ncbi:low-density lipoprotein receptor-related protein 5-like [Anneissia japonica]|uniref:low-density lipoprotein receptor-related protein 5-like n=1 Tax=Anneissia japonica TaxID=1529436 RepID=UPI001425BB10|nr:low-density lipoprotein receptor-related protein 5-like [Anneissia japonica]
MCEHFCVSAADGKHECVCWDQYILKSDGTCSIDPGNVKPPVYIIAKSDSIALFDPLLLHYGVENKQQYIRDIISVAEFVTALTVDSHSRSLFYATSKIKAIRLENGTRSSALRENIGRVYGMAVDWISFNVYWADYDLHHIMVSTYDGQVTQELVSSDVVKPMSVAVDPNARLIFWSEVGLPGQIESSDLNGSNRRVLVDSTSASPTATTLDYKEQRVYFANDHNMDIQYVNYDGTELTKAYTSHHSVQGLTIFQDFIAMAETYSNFGLIEGFHKSSTELEGLIDINDSVYAIDIFDKSRQPIIDENGAVIGAVLGAVSCIIIIIIIIVYYYRRQNRQPLAEGAYINDDNGNNNNIHPPDPIGRLQPQPGMQGHVYESIREGQARIVAIDNTPTGFRHNPVYGLSGT